MAATIQDYKVYADNYVKSLKFFKPVEVVGGFKVNDGFVYMYNYVNPPKSGEGLDDPFFKVLMNKKVIGYSPFANPKEFSEGMSHAVRFKK